MQASQQRDYLVQKVSNAKVEKLTGAHLTASLRLRTLHHTHIHTHDLISVTVVVQGPGGGGNMHPHLSIS